MIRAALYQLFRYGVTTAALPLWVSALFAAEDWGVAPFEIMPGYATSLWWIRARAFVNRERARAEDDARKKSNAR